MPNTTFNTHIYNIHTVRYRDENTIKLLLLTYCHSFNIYIYHATDLMNDLYLESNKISDRSLLEFQFCSDTNYNEKRYSSEYSGA